MGLGLTTGGAGGDIKPFIKFDARAGRMFRVDRKQNGSGQYESSDVDITKDCTFIADLAFVRVGWVNYTTQGPVKQMVVLGRDLIPARPEGTNAEGKPAFRQGFEMDVLLSKAFGGAPPRVFGSAAGCVIEATDALHNAYAAAPESKAGKLPVVKLVDTISVKSGQSTNYKPIFEITGWKDRPPEMPAPTTAQQPVAASTPPSTGATTAPAPKSVPQPAPALADVNDFG